MEMWCNKHNRKMLPSKFQTGVYWCPECYKEKKQGKKQDGDFLNRPATKKDIAVLRGDIAKLLRYFEENIQIVKYEIPKGEPKPKEF